MSEKGFYGYQQKLIDEKTDLDVKIENLIKFLKTPMSKGLEEKEYELQTRQVDIMRDYSDILEERIQAF